MEVTKAVIELGGDVRDDFIHVHVAADATVI